MVTTLAVVVLMVLFSDYLCGDVISSFLEVVVVAKVTMWLSCHVEKLLLVYLLDLSTSVFNFSKTFVCSCY